MHTEFLMGNAAIAMGAIAAGLNVVSGYPGTPSTEVLETTAKHVFQSADRKSTRLNSSHRLESRMPSSA